MTITNVRLEFQHLQFDGETEQGNPSQKDYWFVNVTYQQEDKWASVDSTWVAYGKTGYKQRVDKVDYLYKGRRKVALKLAKGYTTTKAHTRDFAAAEIGELLDYPWNKGDAGDMICYLPAELREAVTLFHKATVGNDVRQKQQELDTKTGKLIQAASQGDTVEAVLIIRDLEVALETMRTDVCDLESRIEVAKALIRNSP